MTSRSYCFTAYSRPPENIDCRYCVFQEEVCPTTGKHHWQGYVEFDSPVRIAHVKKEFKDNTIHCEKRMGTRDQARDYCMKSATAVPGSLVEIGNWKAGGQGTRTDWDQIKDSLVNGSMLEVAEENPSLYVRYSKGLEKLQALLTKAEPIREVEVIAYIGPPGSGKTYKAVVENPDNYVLAPGNGKNVWFDGYDGESVLIIDDFHPDWMPYHLFLRLTDKYRCKIEMKGSSTWAKWTKVIVTSNLEPKIWFLNSAGAHLRRLARIEQFQVRAPIAVPASCPPPPLGG